MSVLHLHFLFQLFFTLGFSMSHQWSPSTLGIVAKENNAATLPLLKVVQLPHTTEFDIVVPYEVDSQGGYISHAVAHHHRRKRSANGAGPSETVHFKLHGLGREFHLELRPAGGLLAPGFTVQTLGKNGTKNSLPYREDDHCFYQGSLRSSAESLVALATCAGMSGLIRTQEVDYIISPLPRDLAEKGNFTAPPGHQPHILYKRSTDMRAGSARNDVPKEQEHHQDHHHSNQDKQHYCGRRKKYIPKPPQENIYIFPDEYSDTSRGKRSITFKAHAPQKLNVETLVVVDRSMIENHGRSNITTYVLTILNMVSTLFKDGTIGGDINIVLVGLILLDEDQDGLVINHHADHTLNSFCQWQSGLGGRDGRRHDHAILLTGLDICSWKNEPCDTLGFAPISGMCSKYRSCTINEDTGLGLAFTIAHESGHNFGMVHDGEGNVCKKSQGNIMSPILTGHNGIFSWSACSRQYLSKFLSTTQATCLSNEPRSVKEYVFPEKLPGELYDADTQCKWQFGKKAKLCNLDFKKDICKGLWCHRAGRKCETKFMPAAEGSVCGPDMWCRRGQCVKQGDEGPSPVDGHWSEWSAWSACSRTCEAGVTYRERQCTNPRPGFGGKFCEGLARSYKLCNTEDCPKSGGDFRAQQCAQFNSRQFRGWFYKWKPYTRVEDQEVCKLYCYAEGFDFFFALSSKVKDGTLCSQDSSNVCIDGLCERVGCDHILGSNATLDACGVCEGNNSSCKTYEGRYLKQHYTNQYYSIVTIPAGARSVHILELNTSSSYLAVRTSDQKYHLNGQWTIDWPGKHAFAGTFFDYKRQYNQPETLTATGPTNETLVVEILLQGHNPGVQWEYSLRKVDVDKKNHVRHNYTWAVVRSHCSASCAGGQMSTKSACFKDMKVQVNTSYCNPQSRPATGLLPCNTQACPPSWSVGDWGTCSRGCGGGERLRQVSCLQRTSQSHVGTVADTQCPLLQNPVRRQSCNVQVCPPGWSASPWSQCSRKCGKGQRRRTVVCRSSEPGGQAGVLPDSSCVAEPKPSAQEPCVLKRCPKHRKAQWLVSSWQQCSVTCGVGIQKRSVMCVEKDATGKHRELPPKKCQHVPEPVVELQQPCALANCPTPVQQHLSRLARPEWYTSPWSQCTVTCGGGVQLRSVQCLVHGRPSPACHPRLRPAPTQACNSNFCPKAKGMDVPCMDAFKWCHLVPQHGICHHKFYGTQCCQSCSRSNL
uniref:ADAM metallopeptidase with thrombospondin type 1 motif 16 n=1 Tax=Paramormyrops kingsleyae TaxID=1676925 RepID=A0A3B3Q9S7_9TELE|nr:A disintegrin and metalloproteinase with thrombospondin motifs 16-like isoform X1 [Paramormyrops kingsleyae]